jgi:serine/threonine protein kinase
MEFKEKTAELKVACPACGLARPGHDAAEKDQPVCRCEAIEADEDEEQASELTESKESTASIAALESDHDDENESGVTGETIIKDDLQVISRLGQGCVTHAYLVRNKVLKQKFVLKVLNDSYNKNPRTSKRFRLAASKAAQLNHPNIVTVYETDQNKDGTSYVVSEYVDASTLADVIKREGFLDTHEVVEVMTQACEALQFAHENKIIHRGIKPSNIFLVNRKHGKYSAKVSDFGTTVALPHAGRETQFRPSNISEFGDPRYMSPEQCMGERLSPASDVYSLGCTMYEALCGKTPFASKNPMTTAVKQMSEDVRPMSMRFKDLDIPEGLEAIVMRALMKDPRKRYQSAADMMLDLQRFNKQKPTGKAGDAVGKTFTKAINWFKVRLDIREHRSAAALATVALALVMVCLWLMYNVSLNHTTVAGNATQSLDSWPDTYESNASNDKNSSWIGPSRNVTPKRIALKNIAGRVLYSSTAPNVRFAVEEALQRHVNLSGIDLRGENLAALTTKDADFSNADFSNAIMYGSLLEGAQLNHARFDGVALNGADLSKASGVKVSFGDSKLMFTRFKGANLPGAEFYGSHILGADFSDANLSDCVFSSADVRNANFSSAYLTDTVFVKTQLVNCNFDGVTKNGLSMAEEIALMKNAVVAPSILAKLKVHRNEIPASSQ